MSIPHRPEPHARPRVAVVVPLSLRAQLTPSERISLRHLRHHLGSYDRLLVAPPGLDVGHLDDFGVRRFPERFFGSRLAHSRLLLSPRFYEAFADYEYILMYHLDALVFRDELRAWCRLGYDYVASPWMMDHPGLTARVGNGGFSLRKVSSFLRVLTSRRLAEDPEAYWRRAFGGRPWWVRALNYPRRWLKRHHRFNGIQREAMWWHRTTHYLEDVFIAHHAAKYDPDFTVAPFDVALRFSWDEEPRECARLAGGRLPFGCHAWERFDPEFWAPYLLPPEAERTSPDRRRLA